MQQTINYSALPGHMQHGARLYIERGIRPGSFLTAVICNDLFTTMEKADDINRHRLLDWCSFFYNEAPSDCYGSPEKFAAWCGHGGLSGLYESAALSAQS